MEQEKEFRQLQSQIESGTYSTKMLARFEELSDSLDGEKVEA